MEALCRCKSGTGPRPGIVPASSGSVSPSSPRSPTSPARCPSVTTARARTAAKKRYACPPTRLKMLHGHTQACVSSVPVKQHEMARNVHVPFTVRQTPPRAASSQTATRTRCQRGASSALVAETAVWTLSGIGVLGRVPSGSRGGRVLSACIIFFVSWNSYGCNEPCKPPPLRRWVDRM